MIVSWADIQYQKPAFVKDGPNTYIESFRSGPPCIKPQAASFRIREDNNLLLSSDEKAQRT